MSNISVISQEYKTASELSQTIDKALLELKKALLEAKKPNGILPQKRIGSSSSKYKGSQRSPAAIKNLGEPETDTNSFNNTMRNLADVLNVLVVLLDPSKEPPTNRPEKPIQIPVALVIRLRDERRGDLDYYLEDLNQIAERLKYNPTGLTNNDLKIIDHLASSADTQATVLFRRLMRR
ncbi:MAG: hypothetical protein BGO39_20610 [Chloroflexi bacterium 54-19]|nr:MAG: hypothetical protein BGO39_20610 [Chloroflexi bacterium 54-19]